MLAACGRRAAADLILSLLAAGLGRLTDDGPERLEGEGRPGGLAEGGAGGKKGRAEERGEHDGLSGGGGGGG